MMRSALMPLTLDQVEVNKLTTLAHTIVDSIDAGVVPEGEISEFNRRTGQLFTASHFLAGAGAMDLYGFVQIALISPSETRKILARNELLELIQTLQSGEGSEYESSYWLALLEHTVPHPRVSDLIYYAQREMSAQEVLAEALAYKPIIMPPPE